MKRKTILLYSILAFLFFVAGSAYYKKEEARKEYERVKAEYEARPDLPVEITYREALLGPGLVAAFRNSSDRHLTVVATFYNPTLQKEENYRLDLAPQIIREVGHSEGWAFASGDTIKIVHNEYKTKAVELP
jgi:hypothetical protein